MRYFYSARLVPIGQPVRIPDEKPGRASVSEFHDKSFEIERASKTKPEVWVNHDRAVKVGKVMMLSVNRGWREADFLLDPELPNELELGQPVSVGLSYLTIGSGSRISVKSASTPKEP